MYKYQDNQSIDINWAEINREWERGKEPQKQFCKRRKLSYAKFIHWRHQNNLVKAKPNLIQSNVAFKEVKVTPNALNLPRQETPVIKINLPNNILITVPMEFNEKMLTALFKSLRGLSHA